MTLFLVLISILLVNVFFGYWRSNTKKLTLQWIMAIHVPVPIAIGLRLLFLSWSWIMVPVFVATFFSGQYIGGVTRRWLAKLQLIRLSSCLVLDIVGVMRQRRTNSKPAS
jgi:hypothetical protein